MTPSKARAISHSMDRAARKAGWRPCPAGGRRVEDHRYMKLPDDRLQCLACGAIGEPAGDGLLTSKFPTEERKEVHNR